MSAGAERNLAVARAYLDGVGRGDLDAVDRTMTEDVEYVVISAISPAARDALPWVGRHVGREAVKAYVRRLGAAQPTSALPIERWVADDDTVVAFGTVTTRGAVTGRQGSWELAFRFDMQGGLIRRYHLYEDSLAAALLHRADGAWMLDRAGERTAFPTPDNPRGGPVGPQPAPGPEDGATR